MEHETIEKNNGVNTDTTGNTNVEKRLHSYSVSSDFVVLLADFLFFKSK